MHRVKRLVDQQGCAIRARRWVRSQYSSRHRQKYVSCQQQICPILLQHHHADRGEQELQRTMHLLALVRLRARVLSQVGDTPVPQQQEPLPRLTTHLPSTLPVENVNDLHDETLSFGDLVADSVAARMGSWPFILIQTALVLVWIVVNVWLLTYPFDPLPFIFLNLCFSIEAAYAAPIIMMSQNRQAAKDRIIAQQDYEIDQRNVSNIEGMIDHLNSQDAIMLQLLRSISNQDKTMIQQHKELSMKVQSIIDTLQQRYHGQ
jgi:uncharacterized membrane protein